MSVLVQVCDPHLRADVANAARSAGHQTEEVAELDELLERVREADASAVLVDLSGPEPLRAIRELHRAAPEVGVVAIGSEPGAASAVEALRCGARGVLRKPFDVRTLERALLAASRRPRETDAALVAASPAMRSLLALLERAARTDATLLLRGESGVGKSRLARWVHRASARSGPFVVVACSDMTGPGAAAELFGSRPAGAGRIEAAHGGTLVLEEVAELPVGLQPALLQVLQGRSVESSGSLHGGGLDLRVIATTRHEPVAEVRAGRLREDLLARLDVLSALVPPLRERPADLAPLARAFLRSFAEDADEPEARLGDEAAARLAARPFPGNVRELENLMRRAALVFPGQDVEIARLDAPLAAAVEPLPVKLRGFDLRSLEREAISRSLEAAQGNRTLAARALGISVRTLRNKIRRYDLT